MTLQDAEMGLHEHNLPSCYIQISKTHLKQRQINADWDNFLFFYFLQNPQFIKKASREHYKHWKYFIQMYMGCFPNWGYDILCDKKPQVVSNSIE